MNKIGDSAFGYCYRLKKVYFLGGPPEIDGNSFSAVVATAYYPDDGSWWDEDRQNYGGDLTWVPYNNIILLIQPESQAVDEGDTAVFRVLAAGDEPLSYQWQFRTSSRGSWSNSSAASAKTEAFSVVGAVYRSGYQYRCIVTNAADSVTSESATLTVWAIAKPSITAQPQSQAVAVGTTVKFSVTATSAKSYQWQYSTNNGGSWSDSSATGAMTATLTISAESHRNGYQYRCMVTNSAGTTTSNAATLTVLSKPTITTQPTSVTAEAGTTVKFAVAATGAESYQWQYRTSSAGSWSNCTNGTGTSLSVEAKTYRNGYQYRCKVTNASGTVTSNAATLTVTSAAKPTITAQPQSVSTTEGSTAKFTVTATGAESYQWQYRTSSSGSWSNSSASSAKTATLSVTAESYRNGYQYRCKVTNSAGTVTSNAATLTIVTKPSITTQPKNKTVDADDVVKFKVVATGGGLTYQWYYRTSSSGSWNKCSNGTSATLSVEAKSYRSGYQYRCKITNAAGYVYSNAVTLTVN